MEFYKKRKLYMSKIEDLIEKGKLTKHQIAFLISRESGYTDKFTLDFIDQSVKNNFAEITDEGIVKKPGQD